MPRTLRVAQERAPLVPPLGSGNSSACALYQTDQRRFDEVLMWKRRTAAGAARRPDGRHSLLLHRAASTAAALIVTAQLGETKNRASLPFSAHVL
jgi:hypothetical protein